MAEISAATPAPAETQSGGDRKQGSGNVSGAQAALRILQMENAQAAKAPAADDATPATAQADATPSIPAANEKQVASEAPPGEVESASAEAAPASEDVPSQDTFHGITPETQEKINKRIGKEVMKRKQAEEAIVERDTRIQELQSQLLSHKPAQPENKVAPPPSASPVAAPPLAHINDVNGLMQHHQEAKEAKRWAQEQLDREDLGEGVQYGERTLTRSDLRAIVRRASVTLEDDIPVRAQFLQLRNASDQRAFTRFPFFKDKSSEEYVAATKLLNDAPWLRHFPNAMEMVGTQILGMRYEQQLAEQSRDKSKTPPKPSPKPSGDQTTVAADASPTRLTPGTANRQQRAALDKKFSEKKGLNAKDTAELLAQREQLRQR